MKGSWLFLFFCLLMASCSIKDDGNTTIHSYKVVVLMQQSEQSRWERTAAWALQNMAEAQRDMKERVQLELTFKDQDAPDIAAYMKQVAGDPTVAAVIGPTTSMRAEEMVLALDKQEEHDKPMITPSATYVQYQRKYAAVPYLWNLAESDITELEVIISEIASLHTSNDVSLALLAQEDISEDDLKNDNVEWFSFIAEEYGLKVSAIHRYKDTHDLRNCVRKLCGPEYEKSRTILFFSPSGEDDAIAFDREVGLYQEELNGREAFFKPYKIYCSDAFVSNLIASAVENMEYEGVDLYASPESGFIQGYRQHFHDNLVNGEAQFYDALCMVAYAATLKQQSGESLNDALLTVVDGREGTGGSWLPDDMAFNFYLLSQGHTPDISGVSSDWTFDRDNHASVTGSTYRRWRLFNQQYVTTEYVSTEGSKRSSSAKNMWDWTASRFQAFNADEGSGLTYPALDDRWALLVAGSKGWANYRFQADVFAMYQLLKQYGYDDDHIVLVCEDDVARHTNNPYSGQLRTSDTGANVYDAAAIDYHLNDLKPADIGAILQGRSSARLPKVLSPDADDNVFVFWSSHGSPGSLDFGGSQTMTYERMQSMIENTPHRKLLMAVEACYSGGLGEACEGLPGCLFVTAANPYETSHADEWSKDVGVFLSNGFTRGFQDAVGSNPAISLRDLYYTLAAHTSGSHVKVYNVPNYGNVYSSSMAEYLSRK